MRSKGEEEVRIGRDKGMGMRKGKGKGMGKDVGKGEEGKGREGKRRGEGEGGIKVSEKQEVSCLGKRTLHIISFLSLSAKFNYLLRQFIFLVRRDRKSVV